jgi:hypothetical protein
MPYAEKMLSRSLRRAAAASCKLRYCCPNSSQLSVIADADDVLVIPLLPGTPARMYSVGVFITVRRFGLKYGDWDPKVNCCDPGVCGGYIEYACRYSGDVWTNDGSDDRVEVGVENEGSLTSRRTGYCWYGSMGSSYKYCVLIEVDAVVVGVDAKSGSGGGASGGNGGCHVGGVDRPSAVGLERLICRIRASSSCSALKSDTNGLLLT